MTVMEQVTDAQEKFLTNVQTAQDRMIEVNQRLADAADRLPKFDVDSIPAADRLPEFPSGQELVANYFDFAGKMLKANRSFMEEVVALWADEAEAPAPKKSTAKKSSKKA